MDATETKALEKLRQDVVNGPWEAKASGSHRDGLGIPIRWINVFRSPFPGERLHGFKLSFASSVSDGQADEIQRLTVQALNGSGLRAAVRAILPDLERHASTHGPGPDRRLAELRKVLEA